MAISTTSWIAAGAIALALGTAGVQTVRLAHEQAAHAAEEAAHAKTKEEFAEARAEWADAIAEAARIRAKAESAEREEENRRQQEKENAILEAKAKLDRVAADLVLANRAAAGVQNAAAAAAERARQACPSAKTGTGGTPTKDPAGVLADVLGSVDARAGILAKLADDSRIAGQACERSYDSLTP